MSSPNKLYVCPERAIGCRVSSVLLQCLSRLLSKSAQRTGYVLNACSSNFLKDSRESISRLTQASSEDPILQHICNITMSWSHTAWIQSSGLELRQDIVDVPTLQQIDIVRDAVGLLLVPTDVMSASTYFLHQTLLVCHQVLH